jgi:hypothetical protein
VKADARRIEMRTRQRLGQRGYATPQGKEIMNAHRDNGRAMVEALEGRRMMSAVAVPIQFSAEGSLPGNFVAGHGSHLGTFTASFNQEGVLVITAANGDELFAQPTALTPTSDPAVLHIEGNFVGGTGRFAGASGTFSHDITFTDAQGNIVYSYDTTITFQRPWNNNEAK